MHIFYVPGISGKNATLSKTESAHCITVLRHTLSDTIHLIDGNGGFYSAFITDPDPRACKVEITEAALNYGYRTCKLHIAIAPPKQSDRFEWFIEKAVEIGIDEITPVKCQRSERRELKTERFEKIMIASMKQAIVAKRPVLNPMTSFTQFIRSSFLPGADQFIAYCSESKHKLIHESLVKGNHSVILIGPEGDFTPDEVQLAITSGYKPVSLGSRRLRTETAALAGCVAFNMINI